MKNKVLVIILILSSFANAWAFNVYNATDQQIYVGGSKGSYQDVIKPGQVNRGWNLNQPITLYISWAYQDEKGTWTGYQTYTCNVPPHHQLVVTGRCDGVTIDEWKAVNCNSGNPTPHQDCHFD